MHNNFAVSIIPARGGSKRFPQKNLQLLNGKPLIANSIEVAKKSKFIKEVFVSTDCKKIADVAKKYGAKVPYLRSKKLSNDYVSADLAVADMVKKLKLNLIYDVIVLNPVTSPFILPNHIDACLKLLFKNKKLSSVTTLSRLDNRHHSFNIGKKEGKNLWQFLFKDKRNNFKSRQSKPINYKFCNLFCVRKEQILKGNRFGKKLGFIELPEIFSHDIDTKFDLFLAEQILSKYKKIFYIKR